MLAQKWRPVLFLSMFVTLISLRALHGYALLRHHLPYPWCMYASFRVTLPPLTDACVIQGTLHDVCVIIHPFVMDSSQFITYQKGSSPMNPICFSYTFPNLLCVLWKSGPYTTYPHLPRAQPYHDSSIKEVSVLNKPIILLSVRHN